MALSVVLTEATRSRSCRLGEGRLHVPRVPGLITISVIPSSTLEVQDLSGQVLSLVILMEMQPLPSKGSSQIPMKRI